MHISQKQFQPPAYFAAVLVTCIFAASASPTVSHLKPLPHFTNFLWELRRQPWRPVPHVGFCAEKSIFGPRKQLGKGRLWQKSLREYFGFCAAILQKILSKIKIHLPMVRIACFSILSVPPYNSDKFVCSCPLLRFWWLPHPSHNRKQPKSRVLVRIDAHCGRYVLFCPFDGGQVRDLRDICCVFF